MNSIIFENWMLENSKRTCEEIEVGNQPKVTTSSFDGVVYFPENGGLTPSELLSMGIFQSVDGNMRDGEFVNVKIVLAHGWRWRIDRLIELTPIGKLVVFRGWGVDPTGYIFPILGNDSGCERVEFTSPTPK